MNEMQAAPECHMKNSLLTLGEIISLKAADQNAALRIFPSCHL